jgi:outer membrane biogenesis lipoprotein LolB
MMSLKVGSIVMREITKLWMVILLGLLVLTACFPETPRATERPDNPTVQPEKKALQFIEFYSPM